MKTAVQSALRVKGGIFLAFKAIDIRQIKQSAVKLINDDWALVSAGDADAWNTMTVSWGGIGELWGRDVFYLFVRPQRYTHEFLLKHGCFTVSMFDGGFKKEMSFCGSKSGRDVDKAAATGLKPVFEDGFVYLEQAQAVLLCRIIATQKLDPAGFLDDSIEQNYTSGDYHTVFVGEIVKTLKKI